METTDPLADIDRAQAAVEEADKEASRIRQRARIELGRAITRARDAGTKQADISAKLGLTREQVRRLQVAAREEDQKKEAGDE